MPPAFVVYLTHNKADKVLHTHPINPATRDIKVVLKDFGHAAIEADLDRHIAAALAVEGGANPLECEVDIMGV
jgi:hypothetical protein